MATANPDAAGPFATLKHAFEIWRDADGSRLGAAIAFYSTLSLAPFLLLVVGVAGLFLGGAEARAQIVAEITDVVGPTGASFVDQLLEHGATARGKGWLAAVGIATLLFGATATFTELRAAVGAMFGDPSKIPLLAVVRTRALALALAIGAGVLLVVSIVASAAVTASLAMVDGGTLWAPATLAISESTTLVVIAIAFTALIKVLPMRRVPWRAAAIGGMTSAVLFTLGRYALGVYIGRVASASGFGASAALVVIMLWVYYSAQMFLLGAALARVCADRKSFLWPTVKSRRTVIGEPL